MLSKHANRIRLALCLTLLCPLLAGAEIPVATCADGQPQTIAVLVRHAERNGGEKLVEKGWQRARTLRDMLFQQFGRVDAVIHTQVERTEETIRPTREKAGNIPSHTLDAHNYAGVAKQIRAEHAKGRNQAVLLYAGHSNTVKPILHELNSKQVEQHTKEWFACDPNICHDDYDNLWTATLCGAAPPEIRKTEFGNPTE